VTEWALRHPYLTFILALVWAFCLAEIVIKLFGRDEE